MRPSPSSPLAATPGDLILGGRYRVVRRLGRGGMGDVFEAENLWTRRRVALKTMRPEHAESDDLAARFQREAQAAAQLAHPHVVDVLDMGQDPATGALFIVQELLVGHDLRAHLDAAGRLCLRDVLAWTLPVMDALAAAHALGVVHRDLKPDNIFLAETPHGVVPKLIDFGIARLHEPDGVGRTRTGILLGTPAYMAPEQAVGDANLDARADVWSLGVVVYEALSGQRPHAAATTGAMLAKVIYEDPRPLDAVAPDLPADLVAVVMGALHRDPARRYPTMRAFEAALRGCAGGADLAPASTGSPAAPATPTPAPHPGTFAPRISEVPTPAPSTARPVSRLRFAVVALSGVALVLAAGIGAARRPSSPQHARPAAVTRPVAPALPPTVVAPLPPPVPPPPPPQVAVRPAPAPPPVAHPAPRSRRRVVAAPPVSAPAAARSPFDPID